MNTGAQTLYHGLSTNLAAVPCATRLLTSTSDGAGPKRSTGSHPTLPIIIVLRLLTAYRAFSLSLLPPSLDS